MQFEGSVQKNIRNTRTTPTKTRPHQLSIPIDLSALSASINRTNPSSSTNHKPSSESTSWPLSNPGTFHHPSSKAQTNTPARAEDNTRSVWT